MKSLRRRILEDQKGTCLGCGRSVWHGGPLTLQLDHKNGNHKDNSYNNLRLLCPNCHSQTPNWAKLNPNHTLNWIGTPTQTKPYHSPITVQGIEPNICATLGINYTWARVKGMKTIIRNDDTGVPKVYRQKTRPTPSQNR